MQHGHAARGIGAVLEERLPWQRGNLALLVATMLSERNANLMSLEAALPRQPERIDMRYQGIVRVGVTEVADLANGQLSPTGERHV